MGGLQALRSGGSSSSHGSAGKIRLLKTLDVLFVEALSTLRCVTVGSPDEVARLGRDVYRSLEDDAIAPGYGAPGYGEGARDGC